MSDAEFEHRRRAAQHAQVERLRATLPLSSTQMQQLFEHLDRHLELTECTGSMQVTERYLKTNLLPVVTALNWLRDAGASCDCEVLTEAEEAFLEIFPDLRLD